LIVILEQAFFARRKPALSEAEGDLGEPREASRTFGRNNRAFWLASLPNCTTTKPAANISPSFAAG